MEPGRFPDWYAHSAFMDRTSPTAARWWANEALVLLLEGGIERITVRNIAWRMKCTPQAVHQRAGGHDQMLLTILEELTHRYVRWLRVPPDGNLLRLPVEPDELHMVRAWAAFEAWAHARARSGNNDALTLIRRCDDADADALAWASMDLSVPPVLPVEALLSLGRGLRADVASGRVSAASAHQHLRLVTGGPPVEVD